MSLETTLSLLISLMSIAVTILLAAIPWAYGIHGRLTTIETSLQPLAGDRERLHQVEQRLARLELQLQRHPAA